MLGFTLRPVAFLMAAALFCGSAAADLGATSTPAIPRVVVSTAKPVLGLDLDVKAKFPRFANGSTVHFFVSEISGGQTNVVVDGVAVTLPLTGAVSFGHRVLNGGSAAARYAIPRDRSLIGSRLHFVAVVVVGGQAQVTAIAPSGPIIGDAIA